MASDPEDATPEIQEAEDRIAEMALAYPEASETNPWGHRAFRVRGKKNFLFLGCGAEGLFYSLKLPERFDETLDLEGVEPMDYGLGRAGWVRVRCKRAEDIDYERLRSWLRESRA